MKALSATPASSSTEVDIARRVELASRYTTVMADSAPASEASGTGASGPIRMSAPNVMARMAPSAAPAETPSVSGAASGFRKSACSTAPAVARVAPTRAPAITRGRRATKKICASTLSA